MSGVLEGGEVWPFTSHHIILCSPSTPGLRLLYSAYWGESLLANYDTGTRNVLDNGCPSSTIIPHDHRYAKKQHKPLAEDNNKKYKFCNKTLGQMKCGKRKKKFGVVVVSSRE